jgi:hypothetical protein
VVVDVILPTISLSPKCTTSTHLGVFDRSDARPDTNPWNTSAGLALSLDGKTTKRRRFVSTLDASQSANGAYQNKEIFRSTVATFVRRVVGIRASSSRVVDRLLRVEYVLKYREKQLLY